MDIQVSSNFERLLFEMNGRDGGMTAEQLGRFRSTGTARGRADQREQFIDGQFRAAAFDDDATLAEIAARPSRTGMLLDPHTATAPPRQRCSPASTGRRSSGDHARHGASGEVPRRRRARDRDAPGAAPHLADLFDRPERTETVANDLAAKSKRSSTDTLGALCEQASLCPDADVLVGRQLSRRGQPTLDTPDSRVEVTRRNVWRLAMSSAIFVRPRVHRLVGVFNPMIGVGLGTPLGSGEETDLVLRAMDHGLRCVFVPEIEVQHPNRSEAANGPTVARGWSYGVGMGGVLRSNGYSGLSAGRAVLRPAVGCLVAALAGDLALAGFRAAGAAGRAYGYLFRWSIVDEERSSSADGAVRRRTLHLPGGSGYGSDRSV
jgi:hypothetical protein